MHELPHRPLAWMCRLLVALLVTSLSACFGAAPPAKPAPRPMVEPEVDWRALTGADGVVFATKVGGTVEMRALELGETVALQDGHALTLGSVIASPGTGRAEAQVTANGTLGVVENARVLVADRLTATPIENLYLYSAHDDCTTACTRELWLVEYGGRRLKLADDAGDTVTVVQSPDRTSLAVGSRGLHIIALADWSVRRDAAFTSPAYASDGALFARGVDNDGVYAIDATGIPALVIAQPGDPADPSAEAAPVQFEFEKKAACMPNVWQTCGTEVVVAGFVRADGTKTMRHALSGTRVVPAAASE